MDKYEQPVTGQGFRKCPEVPEGVVVRAAKLYSRYRFYGSSNVLPRCSECDYNKVQDISSTIVTDIKHEKERQIVSGRSKRKVKTVAYQAPREVEGAAPGITLVHGLASVTARLA